MSRYTSFFNRLLWLVLLVAGISHLKNHFIDYPVFELAGSRILNGKALEIYELERTGPGGFYYSYFFGLFFTVFSALGSAWGKIAFLGLLLGSYFLIIRFSVGAALKTLAPKSLSSLFLENCLILMTLYSFNDALMTANIGILLLALCILAFKTRAKPFLSGFFLASAIVFKIYPALLIGYFLWNHRWKQVLSSLLWCSFLWIALPLLIYGVQAGSILIHNQFSVVSQFNSHWTFASHVFQNLPSTAIRLGSLLGGTDVWLFRFSLGLGVLLLISLFLPSFFPLKKEQAVDTELKMFSLALAFVPILTPVSWYNMGLFYAPFLAIFFGRSWVEKDRISWFFLSGYLLFYCLLTPDLIGRPLNQRLAFLGVPFLGVCLALIGFIRSECLLFFKNPNIPRMKNSHVSN